MRKVINDYKSIIENGLIQNYSLRFRFRKLDC